MTRRHTLAHDARVLAERITLALDDGHGPHEPSWPGLLAEASLLLRDLAKVVDGATFYSHTPDGFETHCSADDAAATAAGWLEPDGEWPEDIEAVEWGVVLPIERAKQSDRVETPEGEWDYTCTYTLAPVADRKDDQ